MDNIDWTSVILALIGIAPVLIGYYIKLKNSDNALEAVAEIIEDAKADPTLKDNAKVIAKNVKGKIKINPNAKKRLDKIIRKVRDARQ
jgi:hypothetical protein